MTLLTFNSLKDEIINGEKQQTIRLNVKYWSNRIDKNDKLDIWWLNPRNQHPDCHKMGIASGSYVIKQGYYLTEEDAMKDGFINREQLISTLMVLQKLTLSEVLESQWIIISWNWSKLCTTYEIIQQITNEIKEGKYCIKILYEEMERNTNKPNNLSKESQITFLNGRNSSLEWVLGLIKNETPKGGTYR